MMNNKINALSACWDDWSFMKLNWESLSQLDLTDKNLQVQHKQFNSNKSSVLKTTTKWNQHFLKNTQTELFNLHDGGLVSGRG